jgi:rhamnosyltransferase
VEKDICAGIITYNPDLSRLKENISGLYEQGLDVFVIDNGSEDLERMVEAIDGLCHSVIKLGENKGVAAALNQLMYVARKEDFSWVLSMDQDTLCDKYLVDEYKKYLSLPNIGALCSAIKKIGEIAVDNRKNSYEIVHRCPTSGFLCSVEAFYKTSGYNEWMFVDYVDYDLCMKLEISGYNIYRVNTTYILQDLGKMERNPFFYKIGEALGLKKLKNFSTTYNHSPIRNYYYVRNALYYRKIYRDRINQKSELRKIIKWEAKKILLEKEKVAKVKALIKGIKDYRKTMKNV